MHTTVNIDEDLLEKAQQLTGISERSTLLNESLRALVQREPARRLAALGGSAPHLQDIPRRPFPKRTRLVLKTPRLRHTSLLQEAAWWRSVLSEFSRVNLLLDLVY